MERANLWIWLSGVIDIELLPGVTSAPQAVRTEASVSPSTPPRALPMCMGPVGLAETNSTMIF